MTHKFLSPPSLTRVYPVACLKVFSCVTASAQTWLRVLTHAWAPGVPPPSGSPLLSSPPSLSDSSASPVNTTCNSYPRPSPSLPPRPPSTPQLAPLLPAFPRRFLSWCPTSSLFSLECVPYGTATVIFAECSSWYVSLCVISFHGFSLLFGRRPQSVPWPSRLCRLWPSSSRSLGFCATPRLAAPSRRGAPRILRPLPGTCFPPLELVNRDSRHRGSTFAFSASPSP